MQYEDLDYIDQEERIWKPMSNFSKNNLHVLLVRVKGKPHWVESGTQKRKLHPSSSNREFSVKDSNRHINYRPQKIITNRKESITAPKRLRQQCHLQEIGYPWKSTYVKPSLPWTEFFLFHTICFYFYLFIFGVLRIFFYCVMLVILQYFISFWCSVSSFIFCI